MLQKDNIWFNGAKLKTNKQALILGLSAIGFYLSSIGFIFLAAKI